MSVTTFSSAKATGRALEAHLALLQELIEEELASGFIEEMPNLEAAFQRWGTKRGSLWEE